MGTNWLVATLRNAVRRFGGDTGGNTVLTFSLALLPIMGLIGAAYDYSRASSIRTAMQAAVDITALKLAQTASTDPTLSQDANTYFLAVFTNKAAKNATATATYSNTNGGTVVVTATASYTPLFMGVMNLIKGGPRVTSISLSTSSTANWSTARLRVALVLDNTGSMTQGTPMSKMSALKTALTSTSSSSPGLLTQLQNASNNPGDVYVSIVPFVKDTNVGASNYSASWIYWGTSTQDPGLQDNTSWDAQNGTCTNSSYSDRQSCTTAPAQCSIQGINNQSTCITSGTCSLSGYTTQSACSAAGTCSISGVTTQSACSAAGVCNNSKDTTQTSCQNDGYCSNSSHHSQTGCQNAGATWHTPAIWTSTPGTWTSTPGTWTAGVWGNPTWTPNNHSTWTGCVMDRGNPPTTQTPGPGSAAGNDQTVTAPSSSNTTTLYPAEQYSQYCPTAAAMGLNYNWSAMTTLVNSMTANGGTNQAIGIQLAWMSLVGGGPFTSPAMDPSYTYQQYIIILTDGLNTQDRWYGNGMSQSPPVDVRQQGLCDNIKAAGVTIYAIQVDTDGEGPSSVLQYCAGSNYTRITSPTQIATIFTQIGSQISKLHIAK